MERIPKPYGGTTINEPIMDDAVWNEFAAQMFWIDWRDPVKVATLAGINQPRLACRICISRFGLKADNIKMLPVTLDEFERHMKEFHNALATARAN